MALKLTLNESESKYKSKPAPNLGNGIGINGLFCMSQDGRKDDTSEGDSPLHCVRDHLIFDPAYSRWNL